LKQGEIADRGFPGVLPAVSVGVEPGFPRGVVDPVSVHVFVHPVPDRFRIIFAGPHRFVPDAPDKKGRIPGEQFPGVFAEALDPDGRDGRLDGARIPVP
jgi:hypothetical protein